jgi:hypothetical protein
MEKPTSCRTFQAFIDFILERHAMADRIPAFSGMAQSIRHVSLKQPAMVELRGITYDSDPV